MDRALSSPTDYPRKPGERPPRLRDLLQNRLLEITLRGTRLPNGGQLLALVRGRLDAKYPPELVPGTGDDDGAPLLVVAPPTASPVAILSYSLGTIRKSGSKFISLEELSALLQKEVIALAVGPDAILPGVDPGGVLAQIGSLINAELPGCLEAWYRDNNEAPPPGPMVRALSFMDIYAANMCDVADGYLRLHPQSSTFKPQLDPAKRSELCAALKTMPVVAAALKGTLGALDPRGLPAAGTARAGCRPRR